jgi:hypothetical protein
MTIALNFELILDKTNSRDPTTTPGLCMTSDGSIIAGLPQDDFPTTMEIWRSTDDGKTFAKIQSIDGAVNYESHRFVNQPEGHVVIGVWDDGNNVVKIWHSGDNGATWQNVQQFDGPQQNGDRGLVCNAAMGWKHAFMLLGGRFQTGAQGGEEDFAYSDDGGLTWSLVGAINPGGEFPKPACLANGGNGNWICGMTDLTAFFTHDEGETWEPSGSLSVPPQFFGGETHAITWVDENIAILAAGGNSGEQKDWPYLYRSEDRGENWAHIPTTSIIGWPPQPQPQQILEVHRLTKDLIIFGHGPSLHDSKPLTRLSLDGGLTWTIEPTGLTDGGAGRAWVNGAIIKTADGHIMAMSIHENEGVAKNQIWRGTLTC